MGEPQSQTRCTYEMKLFQFKSLEIKPWPFSLEMIILLNELNKS